MPLLTNLCNIPSGAIGIFQLEQLCDPQYFGATKNILTMVQSKSIIFNCAI